MDLQTFRTDPDRDIQGVWVEIEFRGQKGQFKIARAGNPEFNRIYTKYKNSKHFKDSESPESKAHDDEALNRAMAQAILMDTGDEITDNGVVVEYTPELGYKLFSDPSFVELKNQVAIAAGDFEQYAMVKLEEIEGN